MNSGALFAGQTLGIKSVSDRVPWMSRMHYDLGAFDQKTDRLTGAENPFDA
jgi:hypothetical protein